MRTDLMSWKKVPETALNEMARRYRDDEIWNMIVADVSLKYGINPDLLNQAYQKRRRVR